MLHPKCETMRAMWLFILVCFGNSVIFSIVPRLIQPAYGHGLHAFQIMLCYSAVATLCLLPWAVRQGVQGLKTRRMKLYGLRAVLEYAAFTASFYSLGYVGEYFTLPLHTALNFISPLLGMVVTMLVLKERSHRHAWLAVLMGFIGVLVVTRPGMIPANPGVLYVMLSALAFSCCGVIIKKLSATESPHHIAFFMLAMTTLLALPAGLAHWKTPTLEGWLLLGMIGFIAYVQQVMAAKAIARVPLMVLLPLNFVQLIFATLFSYVLYHKVIDGWTFTGAMIILAATIYNAHGTRNQARTEREMGER